MLLRGKPSARLRALLMTVVVALPMTLGIGVAAAAHGDATTSTVEVAPEAITANGSDTATVTLQLHDAEGQPLTSGGDNVALDISAPYTLSSVTDNGDGTYTATVAGSTAAGTATITGFIETVEMTDKATLTFEPLGWGDHSTASSDKTEIVADGQDAATITVTVADAAGNDKTAGGDEVLLFAERGDISDVAHAGGGVYTATLTYHPAELTAANDDTTVFAMVNGDDLPGDQDITIQFVPGEASADTTTVEHTDADGRLPADGSSTTTVRVQLKGPGGHNLADDNGQHVQLQLSPPDTGSTTGPARHVGNGLFETTFVAGTKAGTVTVSATLDKLADAADTPVTVIDTALIELMSQGVTAATSSVDVPPGSVAADGVTAATVLVQLRDAHGNGVAEAGHAVTLESTHGTFGGGTADPDTGIMTVNGTTDVDGRFQVGLTSSSVGDARIVGYLVSDPAPREQIGDVASVAFVPPAPSLSAANSTITVPDANHVKRPANGTAPARVRVQAKNDKSPSANLSVAGIPVELTTTHGFFRDATGTQVQTLTGTTNASGQFEADLYATSPGSAAVSGAIGSPSAPIGGGSTASVGFFASSSTATSTLTVKTSGHNDRDAGESVVLLLVAKDATPTKRDFRGENIGFTFLPADAGTVTLNSVTANGEYEATFTPTNDGASRVVTFTATIEGAALSDTEIVTFHALASAGQSSVKISRTIVPINQTPIATRDENALITIDIRDTAGALRMHPARDTVSVSSDRQDATVARSTADEDATARPFQYQFRVSSPLPGTINFQPKVGGTNIGSAIAVTFQAPTDPSKSTMSRAPASGQIPTGTAVALTVQAKDAAGNNRTGGGDTVEIFSSVTDGTVTLSPVVDHQDGTYTATVTSTGSHLVNVSAKINSQQLPASQNKAIDFRRAASSAHTATTVSGWPTDKPVNDTFLAGGNAGTIKVTVKDDAGNGRSIGGDSVRLEATGGGFGSTRGSMTASVTMTTAAGSNEVTTSFHPPTQSGTFAIHGWINDAPIADLAVTVLAGSPVASMSSISAAPLRITADGVSHSVIAVQLRDQHGNDARGTSTNGCGQVAFFRQFGTLQNPDSTQEAQGRCKIELRSTTTAQTSRVSARYDGTTIPGFAEVVFEAGSSASASTITASPEEIPADGVTASLVTVQAKNGSGGNRTIGGDTVVLATNHGSFVGGATTVTAEDHGDGTYTAELVGTTAGEATVTGTINTAGIADDATVVIGAPSAPQNFTVTEGDEQATLTWEPPMPEDEPIIGYVIYQDGEEVHRTSPDDAAVDGAWSHVVTDLENGTAYTFGVRALNAVGASSASTAKAVPFGAPDAPTGLVVTPGNRQVSVAWTPAFDGGRDIKHYVVTATNLATAFVHTANTVDGTPSGTVIGLTNGGTYDVHVQAVNDRDRISPASEKARAYPATVPGIPTGLTAAPGDKRVTLQWTAPGDDGGAAITSYVVTVNGTPVAPEPTGTSVVVTGLTNGAAHTFTVAAVNGIGAGTASSPITATPVAPSGGGGGVPPGSGRTVTPAPTSSASPSPTPTPSPTSAPAPLPGPGPVRINGEDRASTAAAVSASHFDPGVSVVYVATAANFADALAGGPAAAHGGGPVLLVDRDRVPESTSFELQRLDPARVVVLGGTGAVSELVAEQLDDVAPVQRLSGNDRFSTAAAVSAATFPERVSVAYIATGNGFADALSGGAAAARDRGPVLLAGDGELPAATVAELRRLSPRQIVVLGGTGAVSPEVAAELAEYTDGAVERLSGSDRYATSAAIAARMFPVAVDTVFVATGENFPDALAGVPAAAREKAPLLLVRHDAVPDVVAAQLERLRPRRIVILGGSGAVSAETEDQLGRYTVE